MDMIVGLGNPGQRYQHTRHNIGFEVIDLLAQQFRVSMQQEEACAIYGKGRVGCRAVLLVKPLTYMNRSGRAVAPLVRRYLQAEEHLVVVHDDIDLALGQIKVKRQGGDAGHLGVRSIIECMGHGEFIRIRLGIGRPLRREDVVDYVLSPFLPEEAETRSGMITQAAECVEEILASVKHS